MKFISYEMNQYFYTRTKSISQTFSQNDPSLKVLFFAGLTKISYQTLGKSTRKKVTPIYSKYIEFSLENVPSQFDALPEGTCYEQISEEEFQEILNRVEQEPLAIFFFKPDAPTL